VSGAWFTLTDFTEINPKSQFKISLNRLENGTKDNWIDHANKPDNLVLTYRCMNVFEKPGFDDGWGSPADDDRQPGTPRHRFTEVISMLQRLYATIVSPEQPVTEEKASKRKRATDVEVFFTKKPALVPAPVAVAVSPLAPAPVVVVEASPLAPDVTPVAMAEASAAGVTTERPSRIIHPSNAVPPTPKSKDRDIRSFFLARP
jgi:hypothetical protein